MEEESKVLEYQKKLLFYARIRTLAAVVIAAVLLVCTVFLAPQVQITISKANEIMVQAKETIALANEAIAGITTMSSSITEMGDNMDVFITDNSETVAEVMGKLEDIDFEGLNRAIKNLADVVEPLANFFNVFN